VLVGVVGEANDARARPRHRRDEVDVDRVRPIAQHLRFEAHMRAVVFDGGHVATIDMNVVERRAAKIDVYVAPGLACEGDPHVSARLLARRHVEIDVVADVADVRRPIAGQVVRHAWRHQRIGAMADQRGDEEEREHVV